VDALIADVHPVDDAIPYRRTALDDPPAHSSFVVTGAAGGNVASLQRLYYAQRGSYAVVTEITRPAWRTATTILITRATRDKPLTIDQMNISANLERRSAQIMILTLIEPTAPSWLKNI
jgi:hypothetical protein